MASNPTWSPNAPTAQWKVIVDSNRNVQQANVAGVTGASMPNWADGSLGQQTQDNSVVWVLIAILAAPAPPTGLEGLPAPVFVGDDAGLDPNLVLSDMIAAFELAANRTLQPAQPERLQVNLYAYRESLVRLAIQYCGLQSLVAFAAFPALDWLGQLVSITRRAAQGASATIEFTLAAALAVAFTIPTGTLVGTQDGQFQFATQSDLIIAAGATTGSVNAIATAPGAAGNGYAAGQINVMLSPNANIASVTNTATSTGGAAAETDDAMRARIQDAPNQYSVAGPSAAYRFFALEADPSIIDAQVSSSAPGTVDVYVLTGPITQPSATLNNSAIASSSLQSKVLAALSADTVRPLTDTVNVHPVIEIDYQISGTIRLYADADPVAAMAAANATAAQFAKNQAQRIGRDIVVSQIVGMLQAIPGVYEVTLTAPADGNGVVSISAVPGQWANCTAITLGQATAAESM